jgi:hypothetical protein
MAGREFRDVTKKVWHSEAKMKMAINHECNKHMFVSHQQCHHMDIDGSGIGASRILCFDYTQISCSGFGG